MSRQGASPDPPKPDSKRSGEPGDAWEAEREKLTEIRFTVYLIIWLVILLVWLGCVYVAVRALRSEWETVFQ